MTGMLMKAKGKKKSYSVEWHFIYKSGHDPKKIVRKLTPQEFAAELAIAKDGIINYNGDNFIVQDRMTFLEMNNHDAEEKRDLMVYCVLQSLAEVLDDCKTNNEEPTPC